MRIHNPVVFLNEKSINIKIFKLINFITVHKELITDSMATYISQIGNYDNRSITGF